MSALQHQERDTTTPTAHELGRKMASLRNQFGLSVQEVSERLHIRARYIAAIEDARYELMPGKVYARGYVHTYAEFLGLDPELTVAHCFANEPSANAQPVPPPLHSVAYTTGSTLNVSQWRGYAILVAVGIALILIVAQLFSSADSDRNEAVSPVPESMLESVRDRIMPVATNYHCLTSNHFLACFFADEPSRTLEDMNQAVPMYLDRDDLPAPVIPEAADQDADDDAADDAPPEPVKKKAASPAKKIKSAPEKPAAKKPAPTPAEDPNAYLGAHHA